MSRSDIVKALSDAVSKSNALHQAYLESSETLSAYEQFVALQLAYFMPRYDVLRTTQAYSDAIDFVVSDLTGTGIAQRDRELERVVPTMTKFLPAKALAALATAMVLNARILEINLGIAEQLAAPLAAGEPISERDYCLATRAVATFDDFDELIAMTRSAGESLARIVKVPMIRSLLKSMRLPARMAGVTDLQTFLERGLDTFVALDDTPRFLDDMETHMRELFGRIFQTPSASLDRAAIELT